MSLTDEDKQWFGQQLDQLGRKFEQKLDQLDRKFEQKLGQLDQKLERVETTLLTEFHKWASPAEARQRTIAAALRAIDLEMESLSDRVTKLEDRPQ